MYYCNVSKKMSKEEAIAFFEKKYGVKAEKVVEYERPEHDAVNSFDNSTYHVNYANMFVINDCCEVYYMTPSDNGCIGRSSFFHYRPRISSTKMTKEYMERHFKNNPYLREVK
jgi:hypothetical protein